MGSDPSKRNVVGPPSTVLPEPTTSTAHWTSSPTHGRPDRAPSASSPPRSRVVLPGEWGDEGWGSAWR